MLSGSHFRLEVALLSSRAHTQPGQRWGMRARAWKRRNLQLWVFLKPKFQCGNGKPEPAVSGLAVSPWLCDSASAEEAFLSTQKAGWQPALPQEPSINTPVPPGLQLIPDPRGWVAAS